MQRAGKAVIGMGMGSGEGGAFEAARKAILNPLLEKSSVEGARGILINITGGLNISLDEIQEAASLVYDNAHEDANIILGAVIDPAMNDDIRVTVIATGIDEKGESVDLPETTVWKPKSDIPPLKGAASRLSKNVNMVSERISYGAEEVPAHKDVVRTDDIPPAMVMDKKEEIPGPEETPVVRAVSPEEADVPEEVAQHVFAEFEMDMSVSTIPPEDKYDTPSFMRKRYNLKATVDERPGQ
jgi:cell division protein FtsZ